MKIVVNQQKLLTALRTVERITGKNTSLPILSTILLKTDGGRLRLSTTNLELGIHYWVGAKVEAEGEIAIPARIFSEFINGVSDEKITMRAEKNILFITTERSKTKVLGMETQEFPIIPPLKSADSFLIDRRAFKQGLDAVLDAVSLSELRPELNGVFVQVSEHSVIFAATDSFRLAEYITPLANNFDKNFILPRSSALEISRILDNLDEDISVHLSENQIFFSNSSFQLVSRLIDGKYPEYKRIIPNNHVSVLELNRGEFEKQIRLASVFSSQISDIKLTAQENSLEIIAQSTDRGEISSEVISENKNSSPFTISLNYRYILDALKSIKSDKFFLIYTGDGSPLIMRAALNDNYLYLLMPLRS